MEEQNYKIGDRIEKMCAVCGEERGHTVASINKRNRVSRVSCPKCGTLSAFRINQETGKRAASAKASSPYDRTRTYKTGQNMLHPAFGEGEVMAVIEGQKIDVLFDDRMRRLLHSLAQAN
jgi:transcription elongation factor Elf1